MTIKILLAIISSGLLSSVLTISGNLILNRKKYKDDYYKKIIDKRMIAYDNAEILVTLLSTTTMTNKGLIPMVCTDIKSNTLFVEKLFLCKNHNLWLSNEIKDLLTEINIYNLNNFTNPIEDKPHLLEEIALINCDQYREFAVRLNKLINNDLKSLDDVATFLNNDNDIITRSYSVNFK